jgi:Uma2 family endonuclease
MTMSLSQRVPPGPMTVGEFRTWSSNDDRRYELVNGQPVAMAPPSWSHSILAARMVGLVLQALAGQRHCRVGTEAGIALPGHDRDFFQADLAVRCRDGEDAGEPMPRLIVEVLSPGTEMHDRQVKVPLYRTIPTLQEICLVSQARPLIEVLRRGPGDAWLSLLFLGAEATLQLDSIGLQAPLADVYADIEFPEDDARATG